MAVSTVSSSPDNKTIRLVAQPFPYSFEDQNHKKQLISGIASLKDEHSYTDFVVKVGSQEIPVHKLVLAAQSPYFAAMFSTDMKEAKQGFVEIQDINESAVCDMVEYFYSGNLNFTPDNVEDLLFTASLMEVSSVKEACCLFLEAILAPENCLQTFTLAKKLEEKTLVSVAKQYTLSNFSTVANQDAFLELSEECFLDIISECTIGLIDDGKVLKEGIKEESYLLNLLLKYVLHKQDERKQLLPDIFKGIKMPLLMEEDLKELEKRFEDHDVFTQCDVVTYLHAWRTLGSRTVSNQFSMTFIVEKVSQIQGDQVSTDFMINNFPWCIRLVFSDSSGDKNLSVYLEWKGLPSLSWKATATISLKSCLPHITAVSSCKKDQNFISNTPTVFQDLISWNDMVKDANGYIKNDCITIQCVILTTNPG